ncbi:peroxiredoxin [Sphingomonas abietis]|uniref:Peroxiredoxin n=1 Tax=Sphingomonas abietis TaxID=3012344 RepID=A0ABY7NPS3_9SPHN|nr:peroxiredoxin [Sphingomonas abietis]WBO23532.1 peroxiredoxin [Sphingomonas abietis]
MRGLTLIVTRPAGLRAGLELAAAQAALGGAARLFCQSEAVSALAPLHDPRDGDYRAAGLPTLAELVEDALALGVAIIACQSGLALTGIEAAMLDPRIGFGGPVSILQTLGDDRLATL